jgi:hypothetical protein
MGGSVEQDVVAVVAVIAGPSPRARGQSRGRPEWGRASQSRTRQRPISDASPATLVSPPPRPRSLSAWQPLARRRMQAGHWIMGMHDKDSMPWDATAWARLIAPDT